MEKKRPQLDLDELQQLRWLLGGLVALVGAWSVFYLEVDAGWLLLATSLVVPLVLWKPSLPARVPRWAHRLVFPVMVGATAYDFYAHGEALSAMTRAGLLLLLYRAISYRRRRDDLQLIVLGLFLVVIAGVVTVSMAFAVQIMVFTVGALGLLMVMTLVETGTEAGMLRPGVPRWAERADWRKLGAKIRAATDWRVAALGGTLFVGVAVVSALLFMAIPRFQLEGGLFLEGLMKRKSGMGFTDTLQFGDVTNLQRDESLAMSVDVPDRSRLPAQLYWRMVVLDEYREGTFRLSAAMKNAANFVREEGKLRVRSGESPQAGGTTWDFYMEPGVSRYLPLTGAFWRLSFGEPQSLEVSRSLRMVVLNREPTAMKAFKAEGMSAMATLRDEGFARWSTTPAGRPVVGAGGRPTLLELNVNEGERTQLAETVKEITGGRALSSAEFAGKAMRWLGARHAYGLSMTLPAGQGDPLVRWLVSKEPGHCELFAGAFTLLARAAGYPARVVTGFVGGTWNQDYLMVRNSDAHAWCELFDGGDTWVRVDPTTAAGAGTGQTLENALTGGAGVRETAGDWADRMARLRLFWYRRVVNFEQSDQVELATSLKVYAEDLGRVLREGLVGVVETVRAWVSRPWRSERIVNIAGIALVVGSLLWAWRRRGRVWWQGWRSERGRGVDPVRREAGRWLVRLEAARGNSAENAQEVSAGGEESAVRAQLERLRYGPRETWPDVASVWREARRLRRDLRKRRRLHKR